MPRPPESTITGLHATLAAVDRRPDAIARLYFVRERREALAVACAVLSEARRPWRQVEADELARIAGTDRHGGVVAVAAPLAPLHPRELIEAMPEGVLLLALDGVGNPHNLGAILRSAGFFGADALIWRGRWPRAGLSGAALRVAEGAAEFVPCCPVEDLPRLLSELRRRDVMVIAADHRARRTLAGGLPRGPLCLVLGAEEQGVSPEVLRQCDGGVAIGGSGRVESLNVSVAAGVMLAAAAAR